MFWSPAFSTEHGKALIEVFCNMLALRALRSMTWRLKWWPPRKIWRKLPASGKSSPDLSSKTMAWLCIATITFDSRRTALEADRDEYKRLYEKPGSWQNSQKGLRFRRGMCRFLAAHERAMAELEESQGTAEDQAALPATAVDTSVGHAHVVAGLRIRFC